MFKHFSTIMAAILLLTLSACTKIETNAAESMNEPIADENIVSVETAIDRLNAFLSSPAVVATKSSSNRKIKSIEAHYGNKKADGIAIPEAYLVNFEDNAGFAVLGANDRVAPIIAVTDSGSVTWNTLLSANNANRVLQSQKENSYGISPDEMMSLCVQSALSGRRYDEDTAVTKGALKSNGNVSIQPLTGNFKFNQQRTYCHKSNRGYVVSGCAATALAIVVAYNRYPRMRVDHQFIDYDACNQTDGQGIYFYFDDGREVFLPVADYYRDYHLIPSDLDRNGKMDLLQRIDRNIFNVHPYSEDPMDNEAFFRTRYKLVSSMFYVLNNIVQSWDGTGALPGAVTDGLQELRYTNVSRKSFSSLKNTQIQYIRNMLSDNKPVLMGGWTLLKLREAHYWVVDGLEISNGETLVHCNWGWEGDKNGWFSADCLHPEEGVAYDSETKGGSSNNKWNNFCLYTYDMESYTPTYAISEIYSNRIKYNE